MRLPPSGAGLTIRRERGLRTGRAHGHARVRVHARVHVRVHVRVRVRACTGQALSAADVRALSQERDSPLISPPPLTNLMSAPGIALSAL